MGSTSVPGLAAKPTIDIVVVTSQLDVLLREDSACLIALGYQVRPWVFENDPDHIFVTRDTHGRPAEHLHVFHPLSPLPESNRTFRDYPIAHPDEARRCADAKRVAAAAHPDSRAAYAQSKQDVFCALLVTANRWARHQRAAEPWLNRSCTRHPGERVVPVRR